MYGYPAAAGIREQPRLKDR